MPFFTDSIWIRRGGGMDPRSIVPQLSVRLQLGPGGRHARRRPEVTQTSASNSNLILLKTGPSCQASRSRSPRPGRSEDCSLKTDRGQSLAPPPGQTCQTGQSSLFSLYFEEKTQTYQKLHDFNRFTNSSFPSQLQDQRITFHPPDNSFERRFQILDRFQNIFFNKP